MKNQFDIQWYVSQGKPWTFKNEASLGEWDGVAQTQSSRPPNRLSPVALAVAQLREGNEGGFNTRPMFRH